MGSIQDVFRGHSHPGRAFQGEDRPGNDCDHDERNDDRRSHI
jgi:hypothetical protein